MERELILVVYNSSIDDEVMAALRGAGMEHYTKFVNLRGAGELSEPRLNTQIWPGTNSMLLIGVDAAAKARLMESVRNLKAIHDEEGIKAFVLPLAECL